MQLPNLNSYRANFATKGIKLPLQPVATNQQNGLLHTLPTTGHSGWPWTEQTDPAMYNDRINWPKVAIVTPSYNQAAFLEQTIRSVLLQNYPNLEYIVMDGGSADGSVEILEKYSPWISYWQTGRDNGQGQAINMGFSLASGEYYAWINSDDYYLPDTLHKVINAFLTYKAEFVYGYAQNFKLKEQEFELVKMLPVLDYFIKIPSLAQPSCFWSSSIHQPIWEEMHCALDYELWLRLVPGSKRKLLKEPLSVATAHDEAKTFDPKIKDKWHEDHLKMWAADAHGTVHEWKRIVFLNRIRQRLYKVLRLV